MAEQVLETPIIILVVTPKDKSASLLDMVLGFPSFCNGIRNSVELGFCIVSHPKEEPDHSVYSAYSGSCYPCTSETTDSCYKAGQVLLSYP